MEAQRNPKIVKPPFQAVLLVICHRTNLAHFEARETAPITTYHGGEGGIRTLAGFLHP